MAASSSSGASELKFSWMEGSGQVPLVHLQLKATFLSSEGPMVQSGLGQFTTATLKWRPSESTAGNIEVEYADVVVLDANTGEALFNPLAECVLKWEVDKTGKFIRATNVDSVVEYTAQAAVAGQSAIDDAEQQVFLEEYLDAVRVDALAATEAEIRNLWAGLVGAFASLAAGGPGRVEAMNHFGQACSQIERKQELDTRDVAKTVRTKLDVTLEAIANTSAEFGDALAIQATIQDLVAVDRVTWEEGHDAIVETASLRPHLTNHTKEVFAAFRVFGCPAFEFAVERTKTFFLWSDIEPLCAASYIEKGYQDMFMHCNQVYVMLLEKYPAIPRVLEARIADGFDLLDADADGVVTRDELATGIGLLASGPPTDETVSELMADIDPAGSDAPGWSPADFAMDYVTFRHFVVAEASKPITDRSPHIDLSLFLDLPIQGSLSKFGGKAFRKRWQKRIFILDREKATLSYYATATDVKPKGAMDLRDYKRAVLNEDPPRGEIFALSLLPRENSDAKQYELAAPNQSLRTRWVHLINRSIEMADHVEERAEVTASMVAAVTRLMSGAIQHAVGSKYTKRFA